MDDRNETGIAAECDAGAGMREGESGANGRHGDAAFGTEALADEFANGRGCAGEAVHNALEQGRRVCSGDVAPDAAVSQQGAESHVRSERGGLRSEKTGVSGKAAFGGPFGDLFAVEEQAAAVRGVRHAFVAYPGVDDFLRNAEGLGDLNEIQVHGVLVSASEDDEEGEGYEADQQIEEVELDAALLEAADCEGDAHHNFGGRLDDAFEDGLRGVFGPT